MPVRRIEALELGEFLGSLMTSVVQAQDQAARASVAFVDEIGFEPLPGGGERLRTVSVRYRKRDENGEIADFEVEVPLLAMVNVPMLMVKEARLKFSYDVVVSASSSAPTQPPGSGPGTVGDRLSKLRALQPAKLKGFIQRPPPSGAPASSTERGSMAIDIDIQLEQALAPVGLERLFDLAELGITERPAGGP